MPRRATGSPSFMAQLHAASRNAALTRRFAAHECRCGSRELEWYQVQFGPHVVRLKRCVECRVEFWTRRDRNLLRAWNREQWLEAARARSDQPDE